MPDVKVYKQPTIIMDPESKSEFIQLLRAVVVQMMSCYVTSVSEGVRQPRFYWLSEEEIDIPVFVDITGISTSMLIIEVTAYDYPDRMANIGERIRNIANKVGEHLGLEAGTVSITFIPIAQGCWTKSS